MNILGLHDGHNACAALLVDGRIVACAQEERFRNQKNYIGFPERAIAYALSAGNLNPEDLDIVAVGSHDRIGAFDVSQMRDRFRENQRHFLQHRLRLRLADILQPTTLQPFKPTPPIALRLSHGKRELSRKLRKSLRGFREDKVRFLDHHLCHAAAAYYGSSWRDSVLVLTLDGGGDHCCATVSIGSGARLERVAVTSDGHSVGNIYEHATFMLGMVPLEHEYKVMGLAPYASEKDTIRLKKIFENYVGLSHWNPLVFERRIPESTYLIYRRLRGDLESERFDHIAGGLQAFTEELVTKWVRAAIERTGIRKLALAGGVFMNVKVNKLIAEIPDVEDVFIFPSCSDESSAIGATFEAYVEESGSTPEPIGPIYWGPEFTPDEELAAIKETSHEGGFQVEEINHIEDAIVDLLLEHKIVARVAGPMEFGARALGNRSILADPADLANVQKINRMIKMRDFWMPFAPVVLAEGQDKYLRRPKPIKSPYMMLAFDTQTAHRHEMIAAIHQADSTARPQVIERDWNPSYHEIVSRFEKATGRGVLLNTSYNLHGYPLVLGPKEALWTFKNSGLEYLALGHILVYKNHGKTKAQSP